MEQCQPRWSAIDDTIIKDMKKLVIDINKLPEDKEYFRPAHYTNRPIVTKKLVESINQEGFTGVQFLPISEIFGRLR